MKKATFAIAAVLLLAAGAVHAASPQSIEQFKAIYQQDMAGAKPEAVAAFREYDNFLYQALAADATDMEIQAFIMALEVNPEAAAFWKKFLAIRKVMTINAFDALPPQ